MSIELSSEKLPMETEAALQEIDFANLSHVLKALAEPNRLRIFDLLRQGTYCNCELGEALQLAPNLISHHLRVLREAGLVDVERASHDARWIFYSVSRERLESLSTTLRAFLDPGHIGLRQPSCGTLIAAEATTPSDMTTPAI